MLVLASAATLFGLLLGMISPLPVFLLVITAIAAVAIPVALSIPIAPARVATTTLIMFVLVQLGFCIGLVLQVVMSRFTVATTHRANATDTVSRRPDVF